MTTLTITDIPLEQDSPAQRLRHRSTAVRVALHWWGIHRRLTAEQKEAVGASYAAEPRFLTAGKKILDHRHEAIRPLTAWRTQILHFWRGLTLPYTESGVRLIRQADIETFVQQMQHFQYELTQAEAGLNQVYHQVKADARQRLGRLYHPDDYPAEVRGLFAVSWDFPSVEPPSYLLHLHPDIYQQEQERVARRFDEAVQLAEQAFLSEFAKLVGHLTERLSAGPEGEAKVFRDSAVANLVAFFERFRTLNLRSSAPLDALVEEAQRIVQGIPAPQALRDDGGLRRQVATQLSQVQAGLDGMLVDRPRRRIVRAAPTPEGATHVHPD